MLEQHRLLPVAGDKGRIKNLSLQRMVNKKAVQPEPCVPKQEWHDHHHHLQQQQENEQQQEHEQVEEQQHHLQEGGQHELEAEDSEWSNLLPVLASETPKLAATQEEETQLLDALFEEVGPGMNRVQDIEKQCQTKT